MRKYFLFVFTCCCLIGFSQKANLDFFKNLKARNIGPAGMSGRVTTIDAVNSNTDIIYVGAASGGVWKTGNGGTTWTSVFDDQPTLNIGSIAIQQSNPSVVWVGTGEGNPRNSISLGDGIYKSLDAGKTWKLMGLEKTKCIHRIIIDPTNPNIVYAGAIGNPYAEHPERGVYKTTDGGETWSKVLYTNDTSGVADMAMDPSNPNKLLVAMWQHRRTPWSFNSGGKGSGLYMTLDGGKSWKKQGKEDGIPDGDLGRIGLAFSASQPSRVYAMIEATKNGLYKSDDGGFKWEIVNSDPAYVTTRSFYFQDIRVDPKNENRLYSLYQPIAMTDSIKNIRNYIFGKKQEKQGYGTPYQVTVYGRLQDANQAVTGKNKIPDAQEIRLTEEAEFLVSDVVKRTNNFFATKWKDYQTAVETSQIKLFKEVKPVE